MAEAPHVTLDDLEALARGAAPDLAALVTRLATSPDDESEGAPEGTLDAAAFESLLRLAQREPRVAQRRLKVALLWRRFLTQAERQPPARYRLADFLTGLYLKGGEPTRAALLEVVRTAPLVRGVWGGIKRIYKLAEARQDALFFGAVLARLSSEERPEGTSRGTVVYLQKRGVRYLRDLAVAVPEAYPVFACALLREVPADAPMYAAIAVGSVLHEHGGEPYDSAWALSADPLMSLLEDCRHTRVAQFAIVRLKKHFPERLGGEDIGWLRRLANRPVEAVHELLVEILRKTPALHPDKLKAVGLEPAVLRLLLSPSATARTYAIEYARAHAASMTTAEVVDLALRGERDTRTWALATLEARGVKQLGLTHLAALLGGDETADWAGANLEAHFDRAQLTDDFLCDLLFGAPSQRAWLQRYAINRLKTTEAIAGLLKRAFADPRRQEARAAALAADFARQMRRHVGAKDLGAAWLLARLVEAPTRDFAAALLEEARALPDLDFEVVKGLVFDRRLRGVALRLLGTHAHFKHLGLPWLLALARRSDAELSGFATRVLLGQVDPRDFGDGDVKRGAERLMALATGPKEPDPVRAFAQAYLRCHHPTIGPNQPEAQAHAVAPKLTLAEYRPEPFWAALTDARADVRRFALTVTRADLRRWGYHRRVYELADSEHREVRALCLEALEKAGEPGADAACTLTVEELDAAQVFRLTESRARQSREVAMGLITRHYERLGGPQRLAWLMESADRGVRTMAVRMLWERHRPTTLPDGWRPRGPAKRPEPAGRFEDVAALRAFLRVLLFGLPPGRAPEPRESDAPRRQVSAQAAKRRAIDAARALAVEDEAFARAVSPLFLEFAGSVARGEWQACLAALTAVKVAHPTIDVGLTVRA